jgi:hypothetical protein
MLGDTWCDGDEMGQVRTFLQGFMSLAKKNAKVVHILTVSNLKNNTLSAHTKKRYIRQTSGDGVWLG